MCFKGVSHALSQDEGPVADPGGQSGLIRSEINGEWKGGEKGREGERGKGRGWPPKGRPGFASVRAPAYSKFLGPPTCARTCEKQQPKTMVIKLDVRQIFTRSTTNADARYLCGN